MFMLLCNERSFISFLPFLTKNYSSFRFRFGVINNIVLLVVIQIYKSLFDKLFNFDRKDVSID